MPELDAEAVRLRCPLCDWESTEKKVASDRPNGLWSAKAELLRHYHQHFDYAHRPRPLTVLIDGSGVR